jgi:two-component system CheB/CheR fusion protein
MSSARDWSIGQRLSWGFGLLAVLFASLAATMLAIQKGASDSEQDILERIIPRLETARELESSLLQVAIAVRALILDPAREREQAALARVDETRVLLARASSQRRDADGEEIFRRMRPAVRRYLEDATDIAVSAAVQHRSVAESVLARSREEAVTQLRAFSDLQSVKTRRALSQIARARDQVASALYASFGAMAVVLAVLGIAITRAVRRPAQALVRVGAELQAGNWAPALEFAPEAARARGVPADPRDELTRALLAFGSAAAALERRENRLNADARLAASISSSLERREVSERALKVIADAVGAAAGVLYWRAEGEMLEPVAWAAMPAEPSALRIGEGIPGQAAREGRLVMVSDIPSDTSMQLRLGVDDAMPRSVVAVPAMARGEIFGVIVLASLRSFDAPALEFLQAAGVQLGIGLSNVRSHEQAQRLLENLREAHEQVQAQNEELQAQNEEIQAQNEEIQAQSEELQAQNEELHRTGAELAQADERKNQFLGLLAHELRNPLAAISGSLFLLTRTEPRSAAEAKGLEVMERQMRHLTRLIDDLLDVTRFAHGKLQLRRESLDIVAVARDSVTDARPSAAAAGIDLHLEAPQEPLHVSGDRTRLAQVLGNLVSNALKFTPRGGRIDVRVERSGEHVTIRVRDTGVGITSDLKPRLFEPFSQGGTEITRTNGGLGLGLALAKALIELHDGTIEAQSAGHGTGSEFVITLPVVTAASVEMPAHAHRRTATPPRRILVVEDNADAAETLRLALELEGHEVTVASNGLEAVEKASMSPPEVVICDLGIPGIDGFEVARRMRSMPRLEATPLIALSGYASAEDRARSAQAGFTHHIGKPVGIDALLDLIAGIGAPDPSRRSHENPASLTRH